MVLFPKRDKPYTATLTMLSRVSATAATLGALDNIVNFAKITEPKRRKQMNNTKLNVQAALGTLTIIADYADANLESVGVTPAAFEKCTGPAIWTNDDRSSVENTLNSIQFSALDKAGLPRFQVPAEYVAAVIASFVHPINRMKACYWLSDTGNTGAPAEAIATQTDQRARAELVSAQQLFALVQILSTCDQNSHARQALANKFSIIFANPQLTEEVNHA